MKLYSLISLLMLIACISIELPGILCNDNGAKKQLRTYWKRRTKPKSTAKNRQYSEVRKKKQKQHAKSAGQVPETREKSFGIQGQKKHKSEGTADAPWDLDKCLGQEYQPDLKETGMMAKLNERENLAVYDGNVESANSKDELIFDEIADRLPKDPTRELLDAKAFASFLASGGTGNILLGQKEGLNPTNSQSKLEKIDSRDRSNGLVDDPHLYNSDNEIKENSELGDSAFKAMYRTEGISMDPNHANSGTFSSTPDIEIDKFQVLEPECATTTLNFENDEKQVDGSIQLQNSNYDPKDRPAQEDHVSRDFSKVDFMPTAQFKCQQEGFSGIQFKDDPSISKLQAAGKMRDKPVFEKLESEDNSNEVILNSGDMPQDATIDREDGTSNTECSTKFAGNSDESIKKQSEKRALDSSKCAQLGYLIKNDYTGLSDSLKCSMIDSVCIKNLVASTNKEIAQYGLQAIRAACRDKLDRSKIAPGSLTAAEVKALIGNTKGSLAEFIGIFGKNCYLICNIADYVDRSWLSEMTPECIGKMNGNPLRHANYETLNAMKFMSKECWLSFEPEALDEIQGLYEDTPQFTGFRNLKLGFSTILVIEILAIDQFSLEFYELLLQHATLPAQFSGNPNFSKLDSATRKILFTAFSLESSLSGSKLELCLEVVASEPGIIKNLKGGAFVAIFTNSDQEAICSQYSNLGELISVLQSITVKCFQSLKASGAQKWTGIGENVRYISDELVREIDAGAAKVLLPYFSSVKSSFFRNLPDISATGTEDGAYMRHACKVLTDPMNVEYLKEPKEVYNICYFKTNVAPNSSLKAAAPSLAILLGLSMICLYMI